MTTKLSDDTVFFFTVSSHISPLCWCVYGYIMFSTTFIVIWELKKFLKKLMHLMGEILQEYHFSQMLNCFVKIVYIILSLHVFICIQYTFYGRFIYKLKTKQRRLWLVIKSYYDFFSHKCTFNLTFFKL